MTVVDMTVTLLVALLLVVSLGAGAWPIVRRAGILRARRTTTGTQEARIVVEHGYRPSRIELEVGVPTTLRFERREDDVCTEMLVSDLWPSMHRLAAHGETEIRKAGGALMRRGIAPLVLSLLASACGAAVAGLPSPAGGAAATPTAATPGSVRGETAGSAGLDAQKSEGGSVEIVATWSSADPPSLKLAMDTHSVDLDRVDPSAVVRLRLDGGDWVAPSQVDAPKGGHHRAAALTFASVPSAAFMSSRLVEVRVTDIGIPERLLRWERGG